MHPNTLRLHQLMDKHKVDAAQVAELLGRAVNTVRVWRVESTVRPIPDDTLRLLEVLLAERARKEREKREKATAKAAAKSTTAKSAKSSGIKRR